MGGNHESNSVSGDFRRTIFVNSYSNEGGRDTMSSIRITDFHVITLPKLRHRHSATLADVIPTYYTGGLIGSNFEQGVGVK